MDVTISIVNWNTCESLRDLLNSIIKQSTRLQMEIIVVDNASSDDSIEMIRSEFPTITALALDKNYGFAAGHNIAFESGTGRYRLILNPDCLVENNAIDELVSFAEETTSALIVGPKILNFDGSLQYSCRRFPTITAALFRNALFDKLFPNNRIASDYLMRDFNHNETRQVDWVSGAAMLIRGDFIDQIGGFDERFFMYCEDMDLCQSAHDAGGSVYYHPSAVVRHAIGKSSDKAVNKMTLQHHKSMYLYYKKRLAAKTPLPIRLLTPGAIWLRGQATVLRNIITAVIRRLKGSSNER